MEFKKTWKILAVGVLKGIFLGMVIPCYGLYQYTSTKKEEKTSIVFTVFFFIHGFLTFIITMLLFALILPEYQRAIAAVPKHGGIGALSLSLAIVFTMLIFIVNIVLTLIIVIYLFYKCSSLTSEKEIFNQGIIIGSLVFNVPFAAVFYGLFTVASIAGTGIFFLFGVLVFLFSLSGLRNVWKMLLVIVWAVVYYVACKFFFSTDEYIIFSVAVCILTGLNLILGLLLKESDGVWKYQRKIEMQ